MYLIFILLLIFSGCQPERLSVVNQYIDRASLASYHVGTPDPLLECPPLGQQLIINWSLPKSCFNEAPSVLSLRVLLANGEEKASAYTLRKKSGTIFFTLMNDDFFSSGGITAYLIQIRQGECLLAEWKHPLFYEKITIETNN